MKLGTGRYRARIVARPLLPGGKTSELSVDLGARLQVQWNWVANRTSEATVQLPIDGCDERVWSLVRACVAFELHLFRRVGNEERRVFRGPILRGSRTPTRQRQKDGSKGSIRITAQDHSWWLQARYPFDQGEGRREWDPARMAEWLWNQAKNQDPWDREQAEVTPTGRLWVPDWADLGARTSAAWMAEIGDRIIWRVIDGRFEVAGRGTYQGSYIGVGGQQVRINLGPKDWRDDPSELVDATNLVTLHRSYRETDRTFGDEITASWGADGRGNGVFDGQGVDPLFGLLESRTNSEAVDLVVDARDKWTENSVPETTIVPDADLSCDLPYDIMLLLPGVEVFYADRLFRITELSASGMGISGDLSGQTEADPRDNERIKLLLASQPVT